MKTGYIKHSLSYRLMTMTRLYISGFLAHDRIAFAYMHIFYFPSDRLLVTRVNHTKTVEVRIMKFLPYGSPIPLVFAG